MKFDRMCVAICSIPDDTMLRLADEIAKWSAERTLMAVVLCGEGLNESFRSQGVVSAKIEAERAPIGTDLGQVDVDV